MDWVTSAATVGHQPSVPIYGGRRDILRASHFTQSSRPFSHGKKHHRSGLAEEQPVTDVKAGLSAYQTFR